MSDYTLPKRRDRYGITAASCGTETCNIQSFKIFLARLPSLAMPQDFSHQNLRGRSFKGQDLTGAKFSHSNIRGANFTNATLRNAKFINAKAGLQPCWQVGLLIGSILLAALSGFASAFIGASAGTGLTIDNQPYGIIVSVVCVITLVVFCIVTIRKGLVAALETIFWAIALIVTVYAAAALVVAILVVVTAVGPSAVAQAWTKVGTVGRTVITVGVIALQLAIVVILLAVRPLVMAQAWTVAEYVGADGVVFGVAAGAIVGFLMTVLQFLVYGNMMAVLLGIVGAVTATLAVAGLSRRRFLAGDAKHAFVWKVAIALAAMGGTKFQEADLTDADFTDATLKNTDFRRANLTRCCWFQAKGLDPLYVGDSDERFQLPRN